jgi:hypothetical protein
MSSEKVKELYLSVAATEKVIDDIKRQICDLDCELLRLYVELRRAEVNILGLSTDNKN